MWCYYYCLFLGFVLGCWGCKCWQVLGNSSSSQISGTCDSQACCCCSDLNMAALYVFSFDVVLDSAWYLLTYYSISWSYWSSPYNCGIRIYVAVQRHNNQIQVQQVQEIAENSEMANFASLIKAAGSTFCVCVVFLVCYLPHIISLAVHKINGTNIEFKRSLLYSWTAIYVNSSLNPVIYCWRMRHIRRAIMDILRNMSWLRNRVSEWL